MRGDPLGTIHHRGARAIGRLAGLDQHLGLVGKAVLRRQPVLAVHQRQPFAVPSASKRATYSVPLVQQRAVGGRIGCVVAAVGNVLVEVLVALVVTAVEGDAVVGAHHVGHVLVLEAPHRGALDRHALRVPGIDLDDPAEAVRLVRVRREVEARVGLVPAVAEAGAAPGRSGPGGARAGTALSVEPK